MLHAFLFLVQLTSWSKGAVEICVGVIDSDVDKLPHCLRNLPGCTSVSTALTHMDQETRSDTVPACAEEADYNGRCNCSVLPLLVFSSE